MKRNLLIAFILTGLVTGISGQDRIITLTNDTVECKINRVTRGDIYFDVTTQGVMTIGRMPLADITSFSISPAGGSVPVSRALSTVPARRLRIGLNGGMGYIISSSETAEESMVTWGITHSEAELYYKDLKTGIYGSGDITYLLTPKIGLGLRYKFFETSGSLKGFFDPNEGMYLFYAPYREQIYVNFAGVYFFYGEPLGARQQFKIYCAYAAGLAFYRNEAELFSGNYLATGYSFGMDGSLGLEYFVKPGLSVGAELSTFYASLRKFELTDGSDTQTMELEIENYENLSRVELSLGIRFYLWNR